MKPFPLGPFLGINNRLPEHRLVALNRGRKAGDYLRNAVNVDLTAVGTLKRRPGTTRVLAGTALHSLWSDKDAAFVVDGDTLYRLDQAAPDTATALRTGLTPGARVSYARVWADLYWSNGVVIERIRDGASASAGVPVPNPAPQVSASSGGSLRAGLYQVAITRRDALGEESGATWPVQVTVPADGVLHVSAITAAGDTTCIYLSPPNGDTLYLAAELAAGVTARSFPLLPALSRRCQTLGLRPMPAGHLVRFHHGRLLVATRSGLAYSEPFGPALHNPARGFIPLPGITVVEPTNGGVWVVADKTYWFAGDDIEKAQVREVLPYGAVAGTGGRAASDDSVWWYSARGLVVADAAGAAKNLQEDTVAADTAVAGATLLREQDGLRQIVSSLSGADASRAAATSYMDAEVIRKGAML